MTVCPFAVSVLLLLAATASAQSYHACLQWGTFSVDEVFYDVTIDPAGTRMDRYDTSKNPPALLDTNAFTALNPPNPLTASWTEGTAFAVEMQSRNVWPVPNPVTSAFWDDLGDGQYLWRFQSPIAIGVDVEITIPFSSVACILFPTPAPPIPEGQCGLFGEVFCQPGESCCYPGQSVTNPFCIEAGSTDQCCLWVGYRYDLVTRCRADQECCDLQQPTNNDLQTGHCCDVGFKCCHAGSAIANVSFMSSACCPVNGKCCQGTVHGFCCNADQFCDGANHLCSTVNVPTDTSSPPASTQLPTSPPSQTSTPSPPAPVLPTQTVAGGPTPSVPAGATEAPVTTGIPNGISGAFVNTVPSWLIAASAITIAIFASALP